MHIDADDLSGGDAYRLLISMIQPRPIAWVGSRSIDGVDNLAPFSFFMGVGSAPPALAISVVRKGPGQLKDTAENILATGVFTVSIPSAEHRELVARSASAWPRGRSEFEALGIAVREGTKVAAPAPALARATAECTLMHSIEVGITRLMVGRIVAFHIDESVHVAGRRGNPQVDSEALDPLARLGGVDFGTVGERITHPTPPVPDEAG